MKQAHTLLFIFLSAVCFSQNPATSGYLLKKDNGAVSIGTEVNTAPLTVANNTAAFVTPQTGTIIHIVSSGVTNGRVSFDTYNGANTNGTVFQGRRAGGTSDVPSAALADYTLAGFVGDGYGETGFHGISLGGFLLRSEGTMTDASAPTYLILMTTPSGSTTAAERMRVLSTGGIRFTNYGSGTFTGTAAKWLAVDASGNIIEENAPTGGGITVGTTTITSGTNTKVLYNNSGVVGEYTVSGSGNVAMTTSPAFTTPNLGTPSAATLTNATGLPISTGVSGLGANVATFLTTPSSANFTSALTDENGTGAALFSGNTSAIFNTPQIDGTPTGTGVASIATASTLMLRNSNANTLANNFIPNITSTATAAGTTTLTVGSSFDQRFTGSTTQTVVLPNATTLTNGHGFRIHNGSTGNVTVQTNGGATLWILPGNTDLELHLTDNGTAAGTWEQEYDGHAVASGKLLTVSNTITLAGTDGTTMTFPSTSATIARTDGAQTFTGLQTFGTAIEISSGGTGQTTANAALNALLPTQTGNSGKYLKTDGSNTSWDAPAGSGDMILASIQTVSGAKTFNDNTLIMAGSTSGTHTLKATAVSGTTSTTFPAWTGEAQTMTTKAILGSDYTNNTTTGTEITGLQLGTTGTGLFYFEYNVFVQSSSTTTGWKFGVNHTGTATVLSLNMTYPSTGTTAATGVGEDNVSNNTGSIYESSAGTTLSTVNPTLGPTAGVAAINQNVWVIVRGVINVTVSGDLELWAGAETANQITVKTNSFGRLWRIN